MDIALSITAGPDGLQAVDWSVLGGDLATEAGLRSAVIVSLFTDRTAAADDVLPDGTDDRRGWWGDLPIEGQAEDPIGSRLWLLAREKASEATRQQAEASAEEALAWMVTSQAAAAVEASASYDGDRGDQLRLVVTIRRQTEQSPADPRFEFLWSRT
ncbi:phage GP46 family protein [Roseomonas sp. F4]